MKKYLKRWRKLTENQKILFFNAYMEDENMCELCINPTNKRSFQCYQCAAMFIEKVYSLCPCVIYKSGELTDHPPTVIEYCLIYDGWIEEMFNEVKDET